MKSLPVGNAVALVGIFAQGYLLGASGMHLESYWESWHIEDFPNDFASFLESVPATPIGSCDGVNYVTIGKLDFFWGYLTYFTQFRDPAVRPAP